MADPDGAAKLLGVRHPEDGLGQTVEVTSLWERFGSAVTREVRDEHAVTRGERRCERAPVLDRPAEPVHENEGRCAVVERAADGVTKPGSAPVELALLESLQPVFAVCHP
jgi:hypothetical protein